MKFQDSSLNGLKVRVGTKKCDQRTHARSKSNMPHQLFQSLGHNQRFPTKLCVFKVHRGHPSNVAKLPIIAPGAENMEYLINQ